MNSLFNIRGVLVRVVIALTIVGSFAVAISAQKGNPQHEGKMYGEPVFAASRLIWTLSTSTFERFSATLPTSTASIL